MLISFYRVKFCNESQISLKYLVVNGQALGIGHIFPALAPGL